MARKRGLGKLGILKEAQQTVEEIDGMGQKETAPEEQRQRTGEKSDSQPTERTTPSGKKV